MQVALELILGSICMVAWCIGVWTLWFRIYPVLKRNGLSIMTHRLLGEDGRRYKQICREEGRTLNDWRRYWISAFVLLACLIAYTVIGYLEQ